jgi:hypothetical protein
VANTAEGATIRTIGEFTVAGFFFMDVSSKSSSGWIRCPSADGASQHQGHTLPVRPCNVLKAHETI